MINVKNKVNPSINIKNFELANPLISKGLGFSKRDNCEFHTEFIQGWLDIFITGFILEHNEVRTTVTSYLSYWCHSQSIELWLLIIVICVPFVPKNVHILSNGFAGRKCNASFEPEWHGSRNFAYQVYLLIFLKLS